MRVLGIETSCDETGVAVYDSEQGLLADCLYSQVDMHARYGGVVPELASRDHIRKTLPMIREVLAQAGTGVHQLQGIAYTSGPGLMGALLVGASLGRALAMALADAQDSGQDPHPDQPAWRAAYEAADVAVERRREQHRLVAAGAVAQDPLDLRREPVVGHPVGFVEADDLDVGQVGLTGLHQVDQAQRGGDHQLDAPGEGLDLGVAAGELARSQCHPAVVGQLSETLRDVCGQVYAQSLQTSMVIMACLYAASALCFLLTWTRLGKDMVDREVKKPVTA